MRSACIFLLLVTLVTNVQARQSLRFTSEPVTTASSQKFFRYYPTAVSSRGEVSIALKNPADLPAEFSFEKTIGNEVTTVIENAVQLMGATGAVADAEGNFYLAVPDEHRIYRVDLSGALSVFAGTGSAGSADGELEMATFNGPSDIAIDEGGNFYITELYGNKVRKITPDGMVSTLAGNGNAGMKNGAAAEAEFNGLISIAVDAEGQIYLSDQDNHMIRLLDTDGNVSTYAGTGTAGYNVTNDRTEALLNKPAGLAIHPGRSLLVAEAGNHIVRELFFGGAAISVFGDPGVPGTGQEQDGVNRYNNPTDIVYLEDLGWFVADSGNNLIRRYFFASSTFAGTGNQGTLDGKANEADFEGIYALALDTEMNFLVPQQTNGSLRAIASQMALQGDPRGVQQTFPVAFLATDGTESVEQSFSLSFFQFTVPVFATFSTPVRDENSTFATTLSTRNQTDFYSISGGRDADLFTIPEPAKSSTALRFKRAPNFERPHDADRNNIYEVRVKATNSLGSSEISLRIGIDDVEEASDFAFGNPDSVREGERVQFPVIAFLNDEPASEYTLTSGPAFLQTENGFVDVELFAGSGREGFREGSPLNALFNNPRGIVVNSEGTVFIADTENHRIRVVVEGSTAGTYLGGGGAGSADGDASTARFNRPTGLAIDGEGNIYVADQNNHKIRKISPDRVVTTIAGTGTSGFADGDGAEALFNSPNAVAVDADGNVYVSDRDNYRIRKISVDNQVTTIAGTGEQGYQDGPGSEAKFGEVGALVVGNDNSVFLTDKDAHAVRKIDTDFSVSTLAGGTEGFTDGEGTAAQFRSPAGLEIDQAGDLYVADAGNFSIRKIFDTNRVITLSGFSGNSGLKTGSLADGQYGEITAIELSEEGLYVSDIGNDYIIRLTDATLITGDTEGLAGTYSFTVQASDGSNSISKTYSLVVLPDDISPVKPGDSLTVEENSTGTFFNLELENETFSEGLVTFELLDSLDGAALILSGEALSFRRSPDFEYPIDADGNNVYEFVVKATDIAGNMAFLKEEVTVTDIAEAGISIFSMPPLTVKQGEVYRYKLEVSGEGLTAVTVTAVEVPEWLTLQEVSNATGNQIDTYELTGTAPDSVLGSQNVTLSIAGNGVTEEQSFVVEVTDGVAPEISDRSLTVKSGESTLVLMIPATDNGSAFNELQFEIAGEDQDVFEIVNGELLFKQIPDIANPADATADNIYEIMIRVTDQEGNTAAADYLIRVSEDPEQPGPFPLLVNAESQTIIFGETEVPGSVSYFGFVDGEDESVLSGTLSFDIADFRNAGTYRGAIAPQGLTSEKYTLIFNPGTLTVLPRSVTLQVEPVEGTFVEYQGSLFGNGIFQVRYTFSEPVLDFNKGNLGSRDLVRNISSNEEKTEYVVDYQISGDVFNSIGYFPSDNYLIEDNQFIYFNYVSGRIYANNEWFRGDTPDASLNATILGEYVGTGFECRELNIPREDSGISLSEGEGSMLIVNGVIRNNGTITVPADASLVCLSGIADTGTFLIERNTQSVEGSGNKVFAGSPVRDFRHTVFGDTKFYKETVDYQAGTINGADNFVVPGSNIMVPGLGYRIDAPGTVVFEGTPNRGEILVDITKTDYSAVSDNYEGFNMLANPYTADISFDRFMEENLYDGEETASKALEGTIWLRNEQGEDNDQSAPDYVTVNALGVVYSNTLNNKVWNGNLRSAQGFMVRVAEPEYGSFLARFNNEMIITTDTERSDFFRSEEETQGTIQLTIENSAGLEDGTLIGFRADATTGADLRFDASKIDKEAGLRLYSMLESRPLAIQGLPAAEIPSDINIGMNISGEGSHTISWELAGQIAGPETTISIIDRQTMETIDMSDNSSYTFTAVEGIDEGRFSIVFGDDPGSVTSVARDLEDLVVYFDENESLALTTSGNLGHFDVSLVDLSGRVVYSAENQVSESGRWQSERLSELSGLYIVILENHAGMAKLKLKR